MTQKNEYFDNIILGGGAAGLFFAGELASCKNLIIEKNSRPGKKIIVSGGGRCNFTNIEIKSQDFHTYGKRVFSNIFKAYTQNDFINLVKKNGIEFYEKKLGQLFCKNRSSDILNLLLNRLDQKKTKFLYNIEIEDYHIFKTDGGFVLKVENKIYQCKNLIVASGGPPMPKIGGTNLATRVAQKFNIEWVKFYPALVPTFQKSTASFSGLSMPVKIKVNKKIVFDDLLFTHRGFSGPAILKMTLWAEKGDHYSINWDPEGKFQSLIFKNSQKMLSDIFSTVFPKRFF